MKGIILAGGLGTRLHPATLAMSKQLIPIYDKPMIYYPLSILMLSGIRKILVISNPEYLPLYNELLGDGSHLGLSIEYQEQAEPKGIADAFIVGEEFLDDSPVCLILGDNIFYGHGMVHKLIDAANNPKGTTIFGYHVQDPERYGVAEISFPDHKLLSIEEKPTNPKSNYAVTGLYYFDNSVVDRAKQITPSARGELEIVSVIESYLAEGKCHMQLLGRGIAWLDTGTHDSMLEAANFIATIEKRQGLKIACIEEIAYKKGFIDKEQLLKLASKLDKSGYGAYVRRQA